MPAAYVRPGKSRIPAEFEHRLSSDETSVHRIGARLTSSGCGAWAEGLFAVRPLPHGERVRMRGPAVGLPLQRNSM